MTLIALPLMLAGACVGSFINVLVYRIPKRLDFVRGRSHCPVCGAGIKPIHLIPIAGYLILGGKCRFCKTRISPSYPIVELITAGLFVLAYLRYGASPQTAAASLIWAVLLTVALIDIKHMMIPDGLIITLLILAVGWAFLDFNGSVSVLSRVVGFFAVSVPLFAAALIKKDAFGGGDIKLVAVYGVILGHRLVLFAFFAALILGGIYAAYLKFIVLRKKSAKGVVMPFGQFLAAGVFLGMVVGDFVVDSYLGMI